MGSDDLRLRQRARTCPDGEERIEECVPPVTAVWPTVAPASQALEGLASAEWGQVRMRLDEGVHPAPCVENACRASGTPCIQRVIQAAWIG